MLVKLETILVARRAAAAIATGVATGTAKGVVQAVGQRGTAAIVAAVGGRGRAGDLAFNGATNHASAGDRFLVGDAHADGAFDLARNLAGFARGVLLNALLGHALIRAHLDRFFLPLGLADRHFALDLLLDADLLADLDLAAFVLRAVDPHLAGAGAAGAAGVVARILATVAAEQAAAAGLTGFPVAQALQLLLRDGFFHVAPHFLADFAFFVNGRLVANLADFILVDRDALHAIDSPFLLHLNGFATEAIDGFLFALDLVHRALDGVGLGDALGHLDGASGRRTRVAARRRTAMIGPSG